MIRLSKLTVMSVRQTLRSLYFSFRSVRKAVTENPVVEFPQFALYRSNTKNADSLRLVAILIG